MPRIIKQGTVLCPELSYKIAGFSFKIQNELGRFRSERSYADAFEVLLKKENIRYEREKALPPSFEGEIERRNIPDFIIDDLIILDLKAKRIVTRADYFQMKRYLAAYSKKLGIIVNFQQRYVSPKRILA